jgi:hypothetical protein
MSAFDPKRTWNERERVSPFDPRASAARDRGKCLRQNPGVYRAIFYRRFAVATLVTSTPRQPNNRIIPLTHEAAGTSAETNPASTTTPMMASASAPSSTNNPASSRNEVAKFFMMRSS